MTTEQRPTPAPGRPESVEMPTATIWPLVMSIGVTLLFFGIATSLAFSAVGAVLTIAGLSGWIVQLLPGQGHFQEPLVETALRSKPIQGDHGNVAHLKPGMPGYRFRLPEKMHPISAGVKGGLIGGAIMPIPALLYGLLSGHGIWFPINLLAGMVSPGVSDMSVEALEKFSLGALVFGTIMHVVFSLIIGLLYGVLMPTLPYLKGAGPLLFGGLMLPLIWTGASFGLMGVINPAMQQHVEWHWFLLSQLIFGIAAAIVVVRSEQVYIEPVGGQPTPAGGGNP